MIPNAKIPNATIPCVTYYQKLKNNCSLFINWVINSVVVFTHTFLKDEYKSKYFSIKNDKRENFANFWVSLNSFWKFLDKKYKIWEKHIYFKIFSCFRNFLLIKHYDLYLPRLICFLPFVFSKTLGIIGWKNFE